MRKYLLLLLPLILLSCTTNKFGFTANVDAKVIGSTNNYVGIQYDIYGHKVFQDIHIPKYAELTYYSQMKIIPLQVTVRGAITDGTSRIYITLKHNGSLFGKKDEKYKKLTFADFAKKDTEIKDFIWYVYDDQEYKDGLTPTELRAKLGEDGKDVEIKVEEPENKPEAEEEKVL